MSQDIFGVEPGSDDYSHEVVLSARGRKYGLKLLHGASSARLVPPPRQNPPVMLEQNSWQNGRGAEVWQPNANNFYDSYNTWTSTPNKLHPTLLQRWYTGFRDAETNMPAPTSAHKWVPLYAGSGSDTNRRYQAVSFTASASTNRERCFVILRRKGTPGTLTLEWCSDSAGSPSTVQKTVTKTTSDAPDWTTYYLEFKPSSVLAVTSGTAYHIKLYGASTDNPTNCWEVLCDNAAAGKNSSNNAAWTATTYSPYYRITDADINQYIYMFPFDGAWYAVTSRLDRGNSKLYIHGCRGRATAGTSTTLTDTNSGQYGGSWSTNQWVTSTDGWKIRIIRGTGLGQVRNIDSNSSQAITVTYPWEITPDATSEYYIYGGISWKEITGHGLGWVSSKPQYTNGIVYFPQDDTVDIRIMQLNYANANDHGFDAEDTNHNRAYHLVPSYDSSLGPIMVRANQAATSSGNPNGKAISIGKAPTSPSGSAVAFGTDLTFAASILTGDNTYRITGLYDNNNTLYVAKEDVLYSVSGNVPVKITYGADASPNPRNGRAACTGADGQFYLGAEHDVFLIGGGSSYPLNLPFNLPSERAGYVFDMASEKGWLFAAVNAGDGGYSSVMRMTLQDRSWHEQYRAVAAGRHIRSVAWLNHPDTRSHLAFECEGELLYQQMPLYGVRPVQDTSIGYQHEGVITFATIDLLNTDPKYFSYFVLHCKQLANASIAAAYGREVALDYQLNDNVGSSTWIPLGAFGISPQDTIQFGQGSQYKIRIRLRIESNDADNPPVVENLGLSLFSRKKQYSAIMLDVNAAEEEDVSGEEIYSWLVERIATADIVQSESVFHFLHNKKMILPAEPNMNITDIDPDTGFEGVFNLYLEYLPEA